MNLITTKERILSQQKMEWTKLIDRDKIHAICKAIKGQMFTLDKGF